MYSIDTTINHASIGNADQICNVNNKLVQISRIFFLSARPFGAPIDNARYKREINKFTYSCHVLPIGTPIKLAFLGGNGNTLN
jgi:hypothetical protein